MDDLAGAMAAILAPIIVIAFIIVAIVYLILAVASIIVTAIGLFFAARLALFLTRDLVVMGWSSVSGQGQRRGIIIIWLTIVPLLWSVLIFGAASGLFHEHWLLSLACAVYLWGCYYWHYFTAKVHHPNWPHFLAEEDEMIAEIHLRGIETKFKLKLWWGTLFLNSTRKQKRVEKIEEKRAEELEELIIAKYMLEKSEGLEHERVF